MKKYAFRLETVRRVRKAQEDQAKAELLRANSEVHLASKTVETCEDTYASQVTGASQASVVTLDAFLSRRYFTELSNLALVAAKASLAAAQIEADAAKALWVERAKDVKTLDRLDERSKNEYDLEMQRLETLEADDISSGRWIRNNRSTAQV